MKLEQQLRETIRLQGKADSTADIYWDWCRRFLLFAREKRGEWVHPSELGERQVEIWLTHLANRQHVSANTQNQAFSALCYLYRHVLKRPLEGMSATRSKRPDTIREVLDQSELVRLFAELDGVALLCARMMYASSFRIGELGRIRLKDICPNRKQIAIRNSKGDKDRVVSFPDILHEPVARQIESAKVFWRADNAAKLAGVSLPHAFGRKCKSAHLSLAWWYLFPAKQYSRCKKTGRMFRHHIDMGHIARKIKQAAERAEIAKRITSHCIRHSFATHSLESGIPIHVVKELMGHNDIETTETYLHVTKNGATSARSPIEDLAHSLEHPENAPRRPAGKNKRPTFRVVG